MPQIGLHAIVGTACRVFFPRGEWLRLGVVLGNILPDYDNFAVAVAVLSGQPTDGIHRTWSHGFLSMLAVLMVGACVGWATRDKRWRTLGCGMSIGMLMHTGLDLVGWFNGVALLWPSAYELNFWSWLTLTAWLGSLLDAFEFLAFALFFVMLRRLALRQGSDLEMLPSLARWTWAALVSFVVMTALLFTDLPGLLILQGGLYLPLLAVTTWLIVRMRTTLDDG